ncbi:VOC family protein [Luteolibacter pohnpeiensis]|uniref:VOC family protein n=1 Tax=Luteolibacter pohnpeiensis TaxID=454153 RepID=A0A934S868_9BACT|nr:VOC family protein [Luteolibacter pohnpeiensis]MBK1883095.1 VOC family protein [Luteolibacter pohnpeiensis]
MKNNAINWFEIMVSDFDRAHQFYQTILGTSMDTFDGEDKMALFPAEYDQGVGGALTLRKGGTPGPGGSLIYLNVEGDLDGVLARIPEAGGEVIKSRTAIPPHGFIGIFKDSEGNIVGLHSMS